MFLHNVDSPPLNSGFTQFSSEPTRIGTAIFEGIASPHNVQEQILYF